MCSVALENIDSEKTIDEKEITDTLDNFMKYLLEKLYATEVCDDVKIYKYEAGKSYCNGSDVFEEIIGLVKEYKGEHCGLLEEQFTYLSDKMINFVENKILERHKNMQEGKTASCEIML